MTIAIASKEHLNIEKLAMPCNRCGEGCIVMSRMYTFRVEQFKIQSDDNAHIIYEACDNNVHRMMSILIETPKYSTFCNIDNYLSNLVVLVKWPSSQCSCNDDGE